MKMWLIFLCLSNGWMQTPSNADVTPTPSSAPVTPTEDESSQLVVKKIKTINVYLGKDVQCLKCICIILY